MKRQIDRRSGVEHVSISVAVWGKAQIDMIERLCEATGRKPHQLLADIVTDELWSLGSTEGMVRLAQEGRARRRRIIQGPGMREREQA